jgi:hypothetical protein
MARPAPTAKQGNQHTAPSRTWRKRPRSGSALLKNHTALEKAQPTAKHTKNGHVSSGLHKPHPSSSGAAYSTITAHTPSDHIQFVLVASALNSRLPSNATFSTVGLACSCYPRKSMTTESTQPKGLSLALWIVQGLLGLTFIGTAIWKVATPIAKLAEMVPWMGQTSPAFLYATAAFDLLGGLGVLLPSATRIKPGLTVLGALGCAALMGAAIIFHFSRGEAAATPFNFILAGLALFVAWGRNKKAPITPRS